MGRKSIYGEKAFVEALKQIWQSSDYICSKRLKATLPYWLPHYESHRGKLEQVSASSIDRVLKPYRARYRRHCGTKPGTLVKHQIPIRTENDDIQKPGYMEMDTVAHCGKSLSGEFVWSLTMTDIIACIYPPPKEVAWAMALPLP